MTTTADVEFREGILEGQAPDLYYRRDRRLVSPSVMEYGMKTMAHMKAAYEGEIDRDTEDKEFGRAYHCRMLEPARYKTEFAVAQQCSAKTRDGKGPQCSKAGIGRFGGEWLCSTHADAYTNGEPSEVEVVPAKDAAKIEAMAKVLYSHPGVKLIRQAGGCEVTVYWTCKRTGMHCCTRLDKWSPQVPEIVDLKTCRSADPHAIENAIEEYGYARAAVMRIRAIEQLTGKRPFYTLIFQEKEPPFAVAVVSIGDETLRGAAWEADGIMSAWAACCKSGVFPGYGDDFLTMDAPTWKMKRYGDLVPENYSW